MNSSEGGINPRVLWIGRQTIRLPHWFTIVVAVALVLGLVYQVGRYVIGAPHGATKNQIEIKRARMSDEISVRAAGQWNPSINLSDGHELITPYSGSPELTQILERNEARPMSLCSADFDEDGVPDLVSSYAGPTAGGIITLLRGNVDSIYPNAPEAQQRKAEGTFTNAPFLSPAFVFATPEATDFIGAGDFDGDGHWDVVTAARGSTTLSLMPGDGKGGLGEMKRIELPGVATAMVVGEINRRDGLDDVVVGVSGAEGSKVLVFQGPEGALRANPEVFTMPAEATSLALGQLDDSYEIDLAIAAGRKLLVVYGRDRKLSLDVRRQAEVPEASSSVRSFASAIGSVAVGDFTGNGDAGIALLSIDGTAQLLNKGVPASEERNFPRSIKQWKTTILSRGSWSEASTLIRARMSSLPSDNLLVVDSRSRRLDVLSGDPRWAASASGESLAGICCGLTILDLDAESVAVLPMRLDSDGLSDLVLLKSTANGPSVTFTAQENSAQSGDIAPQATTFTNAAPISINDSAAATPYPSTISVSGISGTIGKLTVTLSRLSHTSPRDVDVVLVGPTGLKAMLMSDCGGISPAGNVTLAFDGTATPSLPAALVSGTFKPTDINDGVDSFLFPGPAPPYPVSLSAFNGASPNGTWRLFVVDDSGANSGGIAGGWSLTIESIISVTNVNDSGAGSLRQAILEANNRPGSDTIRFSIPGSGTKTIFLQSVLPVVTEAVTIDGTSQPGFAGSPLIALRRGGVGSTLKITGGNSLVSALDICSVTSGVTGGIDIEIATAGSNRIEGNVISEAGILVSSSNNTIGGTTSNAANRFAGNDGSFSLRLNGETAVNNQVQGNSFVLRSPSCAASVPCRFGVSISISGGTNNRIGGTEPQSRNVISGSPAITNVLISGATGSLVQSNLIGLDATGTFSSGSPNCLKVLGGIGTTIGGTSPQARNVIAGAIGDDIFISREIGCGVYIDSNGSVLTGNLVQGNYIGTDSTGLRAVGNQTGVFLALARGTTVGGATAAARNVISGNLGSGVVISSVSSIFPIPLCVIFCCPTPEVRQSADFQVLNNSIGTDVAGAALPNGGDGVRVELNAFSHEIRANQIAFNGRNGVAIPESTQPNQALPAFSIRIVDNTIFSNSILGIDLGENGVTPNDLRDVDPGANQRQNFPVLVSTSSVASKFAIDGKVGAAASLTVNGTLNSTPNRTFSLQFYFGTSCANSGSQFVNSQPILLGSLANVTTDGNGNASFSFPFDFPGGQSSGFVNSTATDSVSNTSEFSACLAVTAPALTSDFSLGFDQSTVTGRIGTKATITVNIIRTGGFIGAVTVRPAPKAGGVKPKPPDPITTTGSTVTFKYKVTAGAEQVPRQLTFSAVDGAGRTRTAAITLNVVP